MNKKQSSVAVIAHRGFSGAAPENTLAAFKKALDLGVDGIELDVHQTKDNVIVVIHDKTIDRTTNGRGKIAEFSLDEIKKHDAGSWFAPEFSREKIPTLEEVIQLVNGKAIIYIEVKKGDSLYEGMSERLIELIDKYSARKWCILHSFEDEVLKDIYHADKTFPIFKTVEVPDFAAGFYVKKMAFNNPITHYKSFLGFNMNHNVVTHSVVKSLHKKNLKLIVWTVNDPLHIEKMLNMGVDGIISNFPDRVKKEVGS